MINVKKGTKIEGEEAKALDPVKRGKTTSVADVEGQELVFMAIDCPWCGSLTRVSVVDPDRYSWYVCDNCGHPYRV